MHLYLCVEEDLEEYWLSWTELGSQNAEALAKVRSLTVVDPQEAMGPVHATAVPVAEVFAVVLNDCLPQSSDNDAPATTVSTQATEISSQLLHCGITVPSYTEVSTDTPRRQGWRVGGPAGMMDKGKAPTDEKTSAPGSRNAPFQGNSSFEIAAAPTIDHPEVGFLHRSRKGQGRLSIAAAHQAFLQRFSEETWTMQQTYFAEPLRSFTGPAPGPNFSILRQYVKTALFARFWSDHTLQQICTDTSIYASELNDDTHMTLGGSN